MIARSAPVTLASTTFTGWAYQICQRPASGLARTGRTVSDYGGVRLQLEHEDGGMMARIRVAAFGKGTYTE